MRYESLVPLLFCGILLFVSGCVNSSEDYVSPQALTVYAVNEALKADGSPAGLEESFTLDLPHTFFANGIPSDFHHKGIGIINNDAQFIQLWNAYSSDNTALRPAIDFKNKVLFFAYDEKHYNLVRILGMEVTQGIANPIIWHTNWTLAIGGDARLQKPGSTGKGKVNVAFLQIPRNLPGQPGVTAILAHGKIIPLPLEP